MKDLDIKDIWKDGNAADEKVYAKPEIDRMIRKGSSSLVHRFIKTLSVELWLNLVVLTFFSLGLLYTKQWVIGGGMMVLNALFFVYYRNLINILKKEEIDSSVLEHLYTIQRIVKRFILHYKIASFVLAILVVAAVFYLDGNEFYIKFTNDPKSFIIGLASGVLVAIPFTFYVIHLLYGKKARKLAYMIESLEQKED
ncbi:MAG: hypothetical protein ABJH98_15355 [Reichenbachiella sp.]|uniref:hypothetical protein n=1 Tax=Reichenbachiella sp. TaxID=2184521 RepID=UPI003296823F